MIAVVQGPGEESGAAPEPGSLLPQPAECAPPRSLSAPPSTGAPAGVWSPAESRVRARTLDTCECDRIWKDGLCRCN